MDVARDVTLSTSISDATANGSDGTAEIVFACSPAPLPKRIGRALVLVAMSVQKIRAKNLTGERVATHA